VEIPVLVAVLVLDVPRARIPAGSFRSAALANRAPRESAVHPERWHPLGSADHAGVAPLVTITVALQKSVLEFLTDWLHEPLGGVRHET
jgi:hypothetical protein